MKKLILLIIVLAVIAAGWLLYFNNGESASIVNLSEVKYMDLENSLEFSGQVIPAEMYSVMSETGGTIETIYVSEGSRVKEGDTLFELDSSQVETMLQEAELRYNMLADSQTQTVMAQGGGLAEEKAKIALALSQATGYDYESFNNAFANELQENASAMVSNLSGMQNLSEAVSAGTDSLYTDDSVELAQLEIERLQTQLDNMSYKSLLRGTVLAVNIHKGEVLAPGLPAMVIANTDEPLIEGYVYEKDLGFLRENTQVKINAEGIYYKGIITKIGEAATDIGEQSNYGAMAKVQITPESNFKKIPGAVVDLEMVLSSKKNVLAIPMECIADGGFVYVVGQDDKLEKRAVETGFQDTFFVEILSGLSEGEKVVLSPGDVKEGQQVTYDRG